MSEIDLEMDINGVDDIEELKAYIVELRSYIEKNCAKELIVSTPSQSVSTPSQSVGKNKKIVEYPFGRRQAIVSRLPPRDYIPPRYSVRSSDSDYDGDGGARRRKTMKRKTKKRKTAKKRR
jgi:hypothetical protein